MLKSGLTQKQNPSNNYCTLLIIIVLKVELQMSTGEESTTVDAFFQSHLH